MSRALRLDPLRAPLVAVAGALLVGAVLMFLTGYDPISAYGAMFRGAFGGRGGANLWTTLARATPIIGMGVATAVAFRAGFFNLGGEGQMVLGGMFGTMIALALPDGGLWTALLSLAGAMLAGGVWALSAAWFEFRFRVPLLLSTLLMNYPARLLASYLANHPLRDVESGLPQTAQVAEGVRLASLGGGRLHVGALWILAALVIVALFLGQTRAGYRLRMAGLNRGFARAGGVDVKRVGYSAMLASGALAGLVGAVQVLGVHYRFIDGSLTVPLWAWTGLMVALLTGSRPLAILVAGLFFAAVQTGGFGMERAAEVPRELSRVLQALIILFVAARAGFRFGGRKG